MPLSYLCTSVTHGACYCLLPMDQLVLLLLDNKHKVPVQVLASTGICQSPFIFRPISKEYLLQTPWGIESLADKALWLPGASHSGQHLSSHTANSARSDGPVITRRLDGKKRELKSERKRLKRSFIHHWWQEEDEGIRKPRGRLFQTEQAKSFAAMFWCCTARVNTWQVPLYGTCSVFISAFFGRGPPLLQVCFKQQSCRHCWVSQGD